VDLVLRIGMKNRMKNSAGFTLVEVLVAVALMALAMLAIAPLFVGGLKNNAVGWDFSSLNSLAKQQFEEILQYSFNDARLDVPSGATFNGNPGQSYRRPLLGPYELIYVVQYFPSDKIPPPGAVPAAADAVDDSFGTWTTNPGIKVVTLYVASSRGGLQGSAYSTPANVIAGLLPADFSGKQIRMSAFKAP
jgi:prepilin-type N-terminal cleavage/methylation domain-containing protein